MELQTNGRRKFLTQLGASFLALPLGACGKRAEGDSGSPQTGVFEWSGIGFGIKMRMEIHEVENKTGSLLGNECDRIIAALERAFSLYQENSELSRLNRERVLVAPSDTFIALLDLAISLEKRTIGYYQPAIHGAWEWLMEHDFRIESGQAAAWQRHCAAADCRYIERDGGRSIRLTHPLTRLSMNAIGQGYLADCVADMLRKHGVKRALLHLGETYALGNHPDGRPWKLAVMGTGEEADLVGTMELADAGLAVSASEPGRLLIDPVGESLQQHDRVAAVVSSEGATVADAFATAFAVAPENRWPDLAGRLKQEAGAMVQVWSNNQLAFAD